MGFIPFTRAIYFFHQDTYGKDTEQLWSVPLKKTPQFGSRWIHIQYLPRVEAGFATLVKVPFIRSPYNAISTSVGCFLRVAGTGDVSRE